MPLPQIDIAALPDLPEQVGIHGSRKSDEEQTSIAVPVWILLYAQNWL